MIEVFTVGGGEYLVNTFNALAAWSGSGGYRGLIRVVMVMAFAWALLLTAWNMDPKTILKWFMQSTLMYMTLMVPTTTVKITDRTNPGLAAATVSNVPVGIGLIAGFTSQIGDYLTRSAETVFTMPSALNFSTGGIIYGARLLDATQGLRITDPVLATNVNEYFKNCVFYEVLMGTKTIDSLVNSPDMFVAMGPGSVALSQSYVFPDGGSRIQTCESSYNLISSQWSAHYNEVLPRIASQFFPGINSTAAQTKLTNDLSGVGSAGLGGGGTSAQQLVRQAMFINAMMEARDSFGNSGAQGAIDAFAQTRADIQTRNTYSTIAAGAMKWVPLLNIVLTVVFYAMFPIIFLVMLLPTSGPAVAKGYITGFFYLSAWGPLFAVLNMIFMSRWSSSMVGWQSGGLTAANFAGVSAINQDAGALAGYMIMSVPFIAAGMAKGAMAISSHSASFLAPSQRAAEEAALEKTTGNYSYGNTSLMSRQINTLQQDQLSAAPMLNAGALRHAAPQADGGIITANANGSHTYNATPGISTPGFSLQGTTDFHARQQRALSEGSAVVQQRREAFGETVSASAGLASRHVQSAQKMASSETSEGRSIQDSLSTLNTVEKSISDSLQRNGTFTKAESDVLAAYAAQSGSLDANVGLGLLQSAGLLNFKAGGSLVSQFVSQRSRNSEEAQRFEKSFNDSISAANREANSETANHARDTFYRTTSSSMNSELRSLSKEASASLAETRTASKDLSRSEEAYSRFSKEVSEANSNGLLYSKNLVPEFQRWMETEARFDPKYTGAFMSGWTLGLANPTWSQEKEGAKLVSGFFDKKLSGMRSELGLSLEPPVHKLTDPSVTSFEGVRASGRDAIDDVNRQGPKVSVNTSSRDHSLVGEVAGRISNGQARIESEQNQLKRDHAAAGVEADRTRSGVGERLTNSLFGNMSFDGDFKTAGEDAASNSPQSSRPIETVLPARGPGLTTYGRAKGGSNQVGVSEFVGSLVGLAGDWHERGHQPISFGDLSKHGGGDMPGHKGHERGAEVDVRPFRTDRKNAPVTWTNPQYDREKTREFVQLVRQNHPDATILFNDPVLVREGLTKPYKGHDNHLHLKLPHG